MSNPRIKKLETITLDLLKEIGEDPQRDGLIKTPYRVAKSWEFLSKGYEMNLKDIINDAIYDEESRGMVVVRDIDFFSMCEHHMLPFFGVVHVGYIPNGKVLGLSKIPRIVEMYSRRLQIQERMTRQIAETLWKTVHPIGVGVVIEGQHMCMQMRGVEKKNSYTTTSTVLGEFHDDPETRAEFLTMISKKTFG
ncbi:TPA: GTP cyclohydrolase I FolE [Candidatus Marinimicrobia bacterium]|nr:MAG: GTP cyclohydrolase 1 [Marinimicrobia bacterium 46_47]KUK91081.1 MAG: GTP cyclohydrolase I [Marinimicrobia bacterium 46_43]HAE88011.1 GTP cyclohydrolase I FolE [Candidatus Neomarinimicrobiota bacterium]HBY18580.1 GTP cyclohydrolase I FolE [Candidatus Neomarinimicrobiota bacterium]